MYVPNKGNKKQKQAGPAALLPSVTDPSKISKPFANSY